MNSRVDRQFGVEYTTLDSKLFKKQLQSVASVDIAYEYDAFALD